MSTPITPLAPAEGFGPAYEAISIRDNTEFNAIFNTEVFSENVNKVIKMIVVNQDPAPGEFVPAGTPVKVTLTRKEIIPTRSFRDISSELLTYANIGAFEAELEKGDEEAKSAKAILDKNVAYNELSTAEKAGLDGFMTSRFGDTSSYTVGQKEKLYSDMKFFYNM